MVLTDRGSQLGTWPTEAVAVRDVTNPAALRAREVPTLCPPQMGKRRPGPNKAFPPNPPQELDSGLAFPPTP